MAKIRQISLFPPEDKPQEKRSREDVLDCVYRLQKMHYNGLLGGKVMPEDANPNLPIGSTDNYHFFTLPMALNYQRNSYALWSAAKQTYLDPNVNSVFNPSSVMEMSDKKLEMSLTTYKVALQPRKQTEIWKRISGAICTLFDGDIRNLFKVTEGNIPMILEYVRGKNRLSFPYLSGPKICNYWLYVIDKYTDAHLSGKEALTIAPDTHVIQATIRLGLIDPGNHNSPEIQDIVSTAWKEALEGTGILPIDIHTPLWLWSRGGFIPIIRN